jgi:hypothetical protein
VITYRGTGKTNYEQSVLIFLDNLVLFYCTYVLTYIKNILAGPDIKPRTVGENQAKANRT